MCRADYIELERDADNLIRYYDIITSKLKHIQETSSFKEHVDNPEYLKLMTQQHILSQELLKYRDILDNLANDKINTFAGDTSMNKFAGIKDIDELVSKYSSHNSLSERVQLFTHKLEENKPKIESILSKDEQERSEKEKHFLDVYNNWETELKEYNNIQEHSYEL